LSNGKRGHRCCSGVWASDSVGQKVQKVEHIGTRNWETRWGREVGGGKEKLGPQALSCDPRGGGRSGKRRVTQYWGWELGINSLS